MKIASVYVEVINNLDEMEAIEMTFEEDTTMHSSRLLVSYGCQKINLGKIEASLIAKVLREWARS